MKTKELIVPSSFDEITLKAWQYFISKGEDTTNEQIVSIMCGITPKEVLELPNHVYTQAISIIGILLKEAGGEHKLQMKFKMDGVEYGMIPNLDKISYGENKDIVAFLGDWKNMHLAMTVLYRPITKQSGDTYEIEPYDGKLLDKDKMSEMPLSVVFGAQVFFYNLMNELLRCIPNYLEREMKKEMKKETQGHLIKKNGEDMMRVIALLKETSEGLMK